MQELLPEYRRVSEAYFGAVTNLGMRLLRLLALALGLAPDYFLPMFGRPMLFLRPLHYIPRRSQPDQVCNFHLPPRQNLAPAGGGWYKY
jgi:isopenicillin N synthase-like dioxygenase